ncbi:MAG: hypothetical protein GXO50_08305 [Chlorobi bacterium]|nr:hypothetical protein [Chlorobiota bacterium]
MKHISLTAILLLFAVTIFSQNKDILLTVGNNKISGDEFLYIYKKNNADNINKESVDEYLKLFTNFKLKVTEAENLKMDTAKSFKKEFEGYKTQLAKPYLTENIKWKEFIDEALKREQKELKLDIIFFKLERNPSPEDTLEKYNQALKVREEILKGKDFDSIAVANSDDRNVRRNKGHLSYLKPLHIPYVIQNFAFNAKKGELSMPLRTDFGYYLVRLVDIRPRQGYVKVAHIMIAANDEMPDSEKIAKKAEADSIYARLKAGEKFENLVKLSDDKASAGKNGELPEFTTGRMVPEFETAAFALEKPGDFSKPVKTRFGWHIIKLISKRPPDNIEKNKDKIKKVVKNDKERQKAVKNFVTETLKTKFKYKEEKSPEIIINLLDSAIFDGKWKMPVTKKPDYTLFSLNGKKYSDRDFGHFIEKNQKRTAEKDLKKLVKKYYDDFVYETLQKTELENLENTKPEFAYLLKEYHDGMLLFDLMKQEIWDKASEDTTGLKKFYDDNYEKRYSKQIRYDISVFKYKKNKDAKKAIKLLLNSRNEYPDSVLVEKIGKNKPDRFSLVEKGEFSKGENIYADKIFNLENPDAEKVYTFPEDKIIIAVNAKKISKAKSFDQIKGTVISDYQNYLEEQWLKKLKQKYPVTVNNEVLNKIKSNLKTE